MRLKQKLGREPHYELLWHGTRNTDPRMIYEGEVGFNLNYSRVDCMWGIAVYFAKNANYSDDYRFNCANGDRQFVLAEVLIGDTID